MHFVSSFVSVIDSVVFELYRLRVAIDFPKIFSAFVLVDPVLRKPLTNRPGTFYPLILGAFARCDRWASRCVTPMFTQK